MASERPRHMPQSCWAAGNSENLRETRYLVQYFTATETTKLLTFCDYALLLEHWTDKENWVITIQYTAPIWQNRQPWFTSLPTPSFLLSTRSSIISCIPTTALPQGSCNPFIVQGSQWGIGEGKPSQHSPLEKSVAERIIIPAERDFAGWYFSCGTLQCMGHHFCSSPAYGRLYSIGGSRWPALLANPHNAWWNLLLPNFSYAN